MTVVNGTISSMPNADLDPVLSEVASPVVFIYGSQKGRLCSVLSQSLEIQVGLDSCELELGRAITVRIRTGGCPVAFLIRADPSSWRIVRESTIVLHVHPLRLRLARRLAPIGRGSHSRLRMLVPSYFAYTEVDETSYRG